MDAKLEPHRYGDQYQHRNRHGNHNPNADLDGYCFVNTFDNSHHDFDADSDSYGNLDFDPYRKFDRYADVDVDLFPHIYPDADFHPNSNRHALADNNDVPNEYTDRDQHRDANRDAPRQRDTHRHGDRHPDANPDEHRNGHQHGSRIASPVGHQHRNPYRNGDSVAYARTERSPDYLLDPVANRDQQLDRDPHGRGVENAYSGWARRSDNHSHAVRHRNSHAPLGVDTDGHEDRR